MKLIVILSVVISFSGNAQEQYHRRGEMYVFWGWNRDAYTRSDIHFTGDNYDFTLQGACGKDRQSPFSVKTYFGPQSLTIPQYNFRIGFYLNDKYDISIASDHMKYVLRNDQKVNVTGYVENSGTIYDGKYNEDPVEISRDFILFEHTDGLNYANVELRRSDVWFTRPKFRFESRVGAGIGALIPRTNATVLNNERYDEFHLAGYGTAIMAGAHFSFFKNFFVLAQAKGGFINMPDIRITMNESDRASQHFFFLQLGGVFGVNFNLIKEKSK